MDYIGDMALSFSQGGLQMRFPSALTRALQDAGYTRVKIYVSEEGILFKPYLGSGKLKTVTLPAWRDE